MRIADNQCDEAALTGFGVEACELIAKGDYCTLADRFSYALAFGRDIAEAIQVDLEYGLSQCGSSKPLALSKQPAIRVGFFKPSDAPFVAVVECRLELMGGTGSLDVDLIVTTNGDEKHVTLEDISYTT